MSDFHRTHEWELIAKTPGNLGFDVKCRCKYCGETYEGVMNSSDRLVRITKEAEHFECPNAPEPKVPRSNKPIGLWNWASEID